MKSCARLMLEKNHLDGRFIGENDETVVRLVIVGFGRMGESVALWAARLGHFANGEKQKLHVIIIDQEASARAIV